MSKSDKIKADIDFHKHLFLGTMGALLALVAWVATSYKTVDWPLLLLSLIISIGASIFAFFQYRRVKKLIEELGNVE